MALALLGGCRIGTVFETDVQCDFDVELGPDAAVAVVDRLLNQPWRSAWDAATPVTEDHDQ